MSESSSDNITVRCACGTKLKVSAANVGKKARCPKCKEVLTISAPKAADDGDFGATDLLAQLAQSEASASTLSAGPQAPRVIPCPGCRGSMASTAKVCVSCGYNVETGRVMKAASAHPGAAKQVVKKLASAGGAWGLGCVYAGMGVLLGAAVWVAIAIGTGFEIGWIAWGVGALAGFGMNLGYREESSLAGIVAGGIAVLGILVAKAVVFAFVIYAVVSGDTSDTSLIREHVIFGMALESLNEQGLVKPAEREMAYPGAYRLAAFNVSKMSKDKLKKRRDEFRDTAARMDAAGDPSGMKTVLVAYDRKEKRERLALHRTELESMRKGFQPYQDERDELHTAISKELESLSGEALNAEANKLDVWEETGRYSDTEYIRNRLLYRELKLEEREQFQAAIQTERSDRFEPLTADEWKSKHRNMLTRVDEMSPAERDDRLREIDPGWAGGSIGDDPADEEQVAAASSAILGVFLGTLVRPFNLLILALAVASAYKLGRAGRPD